MAPIQSSRDAHLEAGLLRNTEEEKTGYQAPGSKDFQQSPQTSNRKMAPILKVLLACLVGTFIGLEFVAARQNMRHMRGVSIEKAKTDIVEEHKGHSDASKEDILHRLLHAYLPERYQHGIYASDHEALKAVRDNDPSLATALAQMVKREDPPNTNTTSSVSDSVNPPTTSTPVTTSEPSSTPVTTSSTPPVDPTTSTPDVPTTTPEPPTTSQPPPQTTTSSPEPETTPTPTQPPATSTGMSTSEEAPFSTSSTLSIAPESTPTPGRLSQSSSPPSLPPSIQSFTLTTVIVTSPIPSIPSSSTGAIQTITTPPDPEETPSETDTATSPERTITAGRKATSSPVKQVFTRTLPNGGTTTLTSTSWVAVVPTGTADGSSDADLQNAGSRQQGEMLLPAAIGILVGGMLMV